MKLSEILSQYNQPISETIRTQLYETPTSTLRLLNEAHMPLEILLGLNLTLFRQLTGASALVVSLVNQHNLTWEAQLALDPTIRTQLYETPTSTLRLLNEAHMPLETLLGLEAPIRAELYRQNDHFVQLFSEARQAHQYLITHGIITNEQLVISLFNQNPYLIIQNLVNQNLMAADIVPQDHQLNAVNIADLIVLVKGVAEIRKNSRVLSQQVTISSNENLLFSRIPNDVKAKIAGFTGNNREDESRIATWNYRKPGL